MLNKLIISASLLIALSLSANSFAGVITDTVTQSAFVGWFDSHSYEHDITDDGFDIGTALSGTLEIAISDDGGWFDGGELVLFTVEAFDLDTGGFSFGSAFSGDLEVNALGALNTDGLLGITISSLWGDFYVENSTLTVTTAVSEPASIALLGLGLLGLGFARRKTA